MKIQHILAYILTFILCQKSISQGVFDQGFMIASSHSADALFFKNKKALLLRDEKHGNINMLTEITSGVNAQYINNRNMFSLGIGHTVQTFRMSNDLDGIDTWFWSEGKDPDTRFYEARYINSYIALPFCYTRLLAVTESSRLTFFVQAEISNEFLYRTDLDMSYYEEPPADEAELLSLLKSYQNQQHQARLRFGFGFKWRAYTPGFGYFFKIYNQTIFTSVNDEFVGRPYGGGIVMGMQYQFQKAKKLINRA